MIAQISSKDIKVDELPLSLDEFISLTPTLVIEKQPVFTLALAHEIRNPLTNINLAVEMLQSATQEDEKKMCLEIISRSSFRINALIDDLLANYEAKEVPLEIMHVDQLLDEVLAMINDRIMLKNVVVKKNYTEQDSKVLINKEQILIALINIIINAIDAMPAGKGELNLTTRAIRETCIIEIEDNGIGINKKNLKNIFKPYFTNKPQGKGLGLSTALTSLLSNHARIRVNSEEGKGAQFVLFFERISAIEGVFK